MNTSKVMQFNTRLLVITACRVLHLWFTLHRKRVAEIFSHNCMLNNEHPFKNTVKKQSCFSACSTLQHVKYW